MRALVFGLALAVVGATAVVAQPRECDELVRACKMKDRLGEQGEGNCKKARECVAEAKCNRLKRACLYKEERGQEGRGNCARYREECRS
jgi:hypothetical protein